MKLGLWPVAVLLAAGAAGAAEYSLEDVGEFAPQGHRVEFADRFGWRRYSARFEFGLDRSVRNLTEGSRLTLRIYKRDGKAWTYTCRARGAAPLGANVNFLHGKGISVVAECRIPEGQFAKAVGLDKADVGLPSLVFHAMIQDGQVTPGAQRGLYFAPRVQVESSELNAYASRDQDPTNLAVQFQSN